MKSQETKRCTLHCKWSQATSSLQCNANIIIGPWSSAGSVPAPTGDWANENNTKEAR